MRAVDRARARVREAGGVELLERLEHLDTVREAPPRSATPAFIAAPARGDALDADVVIAGGGLWSSLAPLLASRGLRVVVLDRARAGQAHREWNASGLELDALVTSGLFTPAERDGLVVARYQKGTCRFAGGGEYPVHGVLDHAVDAGAFLARIRAAGERAAVRFLDGHAVSGHASSPAGVRVLASGLGGSGVVALTARVLVDARGASSPFATGDLVCPTVGGVLEGLAQGEAPDAIDPNVGEILVTTEGADAGRQHVWEAFPGRPGETTVYLFYYARAAEPVSLAELYARFFDTLPRYKRGAARLVRPTFGLIPGWSRLVPAPSSHDPRVVLVGDAAARHSPLTYCGFGAALRSFERAARAIASRVEGDARDDGPAVDDRPLHALTGALARLLASRALPGDEANRLLDAAFGTLHDLGNQAYASLLRDEMDGRAFVAFLRETARRHPSVWRHVTRGLGPWTAGRWGLSVARSVWSSRAP